jgi:hypothetical protein
MGEVVSLESHRRARAARLAPEHGVVDRLAHAVERLETALGEVMAAGGADEPVIRRELLAVNGAVDGGRYALAADRTERLIALLGHG